MDYHTGIAEVDEGLDARFEILSPTVRQLLKGDSIPNLANELSERFQLTDTMREGVEVEMSMILMYLEPVDDFAANLITEYDVPAETALEIEREVHAKLFEPIIGELGSSEDDGTNDSNVDDSNEVTPTTILPPIATPSQATTPILTQSPPVAPVPNPTPAPHVPVARVMPHNQTEAQHDPRTSTELPNALLQNLKASLMHSVPEEPLEGTNPAPSYNAILSPKPATPPTTPPNMPPHP